MGKHEGEYKAGEKRVEFSKLIVILATTMWLVVNLFGMVMMVVTLDLSPMVYVIASVDAVMAVCCAVYSSKAKAENMIKLKKIYGDDANIIIPSYYQSDPVYPGYDEVPGFDDYYENSNIV